MMGSDTISTQNLCTLVVRCLQTHPESAHGLTLQLLVEDVWKTFEESTLPNPFTKQADDDTAKSESVESEDSSSCKSKRVENGDGETQGSTEDGKEEDEAQRKQEDIACLRSKIQTVMEILCSTPLVEAHSYVGDEVRDDKRYRLRCTVALPLKSPIDFKGIVMEINKESERCRERQDRIKRIKAEIRKISEKSRNRSTVKHDRLQGALRNIVGDAESIFQAEPAYRDLQSALKKAKTGR